MYNVSMKTSLKLNLKERFFCLGIFNGVKSGDLVEWGFINKAQEMLSATKEDIKKYEMEQGKEGRWSWNEKASEEVEYKFSTEASTILKRELETMNKGKKITPELVSLASKVLSED